MPSENKHSPTRAKQIQNALQMTVD